MKRSAGFWALKYALWMLLILTILLLIVLPLVSSLLVSSLPRVPVGLTKYLRIIETVQGYLLQVLTAAWFFYVGSCLASFLNVVAWRVPRGRTILGSSKCPHCDSKLTFRDNIPIIGWLKNKGHCRLCETPISSRYFWVEVLLGTLFLAIVLVSLVTGGINLPLRVPDVGKGFERILFDPQWDLIQIVVQHLTLISILFTFTLIRCDDQKIPRSIVLFAIMVGVVFAFAFPAVALVPWRNPSTSVAGYQTFDFDQVIFLVLGSITGVFSSLILSFFERHATRSSIRSTICSLALCGLFLGWQSAISIGLIVLLLQLIFSIVNRDDPAWFNRPGQILVATVIHLFGWRATSHAFGFWPNQESHGIQIVLAMAVMISLAWLHPLIAAKRAIQDASQAIDSAKSSRGS